MKTKINKEKWIAGITTSLLVVALIGIGFYHSSNNTLRGGLDQEKLKSENLLAEKLALAKEAEKLKSDILSWKGKSEEADKLLNNALARINDMETTIKGLRKENSTVASLRKELNDLKQIRQNLEDQLAALEKQNLDNLKKIEDMNAELIALKVERDDLKEDVTALQIALTDGFRIESTKGKKQKLTVKAARTNQMMVSFEIPEKMVEDIRFNIVTPKGTVIKSDSGDLSHSIVDESRPMIASLSPYTGEFEVSKRIEMIYRPKQKLSAGIYKIKIFNGNDYVGSCQVRLK